MAVSCSFLQGLRQRFVETLNLDEEHGIFPKNAQVFAAIGAAICAEQYDNTDYDSLISRLENTVTASSITNPMPPLFENEEENRIKLMLANTGNMKQFVKTE